MDYFNYNRRQSSVVQIGNKQLGGNNPILIQSMANVSTLDTNACVEQSHTHHRCRRRLCPVHGSGNQEAENLGVIRRELTGEDIQIRLLPIFTLTPKLQMPLLR